MKTMRKIIVRMHHRYIILVLMAFLTLLVDVAIADVAHHHDSLSEKAMKTSAVTMKSDSIIECNTLIVANDLRSGDITPLQTEQIDKTDGWPLSWKIFATFIYPIITLLIGVWIKTAISSRADKRRSRKTGKRWLAELSAQYADVERQIVAFNTFITDYCDNRNRFDIPSISYGLINSRNFDALGKEDLYDYLSRLLKKQDQKKVDGTYRKITGIISALDLIDTQTRTHIQKFLDRSNALVEAYNANLVQYDKLLRQIPVEYPGISKPIVMSLKMKYFTIAKDMPKINLFDCEDSFVRPSLEILRSNPFPPELDDTLQNCLNITLGLRNEKAYIKSNLESANAQYEKVLEKIDEINKLCRP
ncbi:MAG: hypothetical protein V8Q28_03455 [Alistipes sp.]